MRNGEKESKLSEKSKRKEKRPNKKKRFEQKTKFSQEKIPVFPVQSFRSGQSNSLLD